MDHVYMENTPIGRLLITSEDQAITGVFMINHKHSPAWLDNLHAELSDRDGRRNAPVLSEAQKQLDQYFGSKRKSFNLPLKLQGTPFQLKVWQRLQEIPYGVTITYSRLAQLVGDTNARRAVGSANGRNPISIIVPCHRVIGANGKLTGYGGGLDNKSILLELEHSTKTIVKATKDNAILVGI